jgi:uncharacterized protein DUF4331
LLKRRTAKRALAAVTTMALGAGLLISLAPTPGVASSHREAPLVSADPQIDATDLYTFRSPDKPNTVTLISSWIPFEEPAGGPNFFPWAEGVNYDIKIDNNHNAKADIVYRWVFTDHRRGGGNSFLYNNGAVDALNDPNLLFFQTYDLYRIRDDRKRLLVDNAVSVPSNVGQTSMPDFNALSDSGVAAVGTYGKTWAGQSDDPFFLDLRVFDLLYGPPGMTEVGDDTLEGFNVNTLAIQVPRSQLAKKGDVASHPIIGAWTTASRRSIQISKPNGSIRGDGRTVQVSRLGAPLVNEVVVPVKDKDLFNASKPKDDGQFLKYVTNSELAVLLNALYGVGAPETGRDDLVEVFLTGVAGLNQPSGVTASEQLRLNMTTPVCEPPGCAEYSTLGVIGGDNAGYPNGRRLADDAIDISLQVVGGELAANPNGLSDSVDANDVSFLSEFPYVGYAHSGSDADPH